MVKSWYRNSFFVILVLLSFTTPAALNGQQVLFNTIADFGPLEDWPHSGLQTIDGGFVTLGKHLSGTNSIESDSTQLIKFDRYGCMEWSRLYKLWKVQ